MQIAERVLELDDNGAVEVPEIFAGLARDQSTLFMEGVLYDGVAGRGCARRER